MPNINTFPTGRHLHHSITQVLHDKHKKNVIFYYYGKYISRDVIMGHIITGLFRVVCFGLILWIMCIRVDMGLKVGIVWSILCGWWVGIRHLILFLLVLGILGIGFCYCYLFFMFGTYGIFGCILCTVCVRSELISVALVSQCGYHMGVCIMGIVSNLITFSGVTIFPAD